MNEAELRQALRKALPVFQAHLQANDDALIAALVADGIDRALATRIVQFTPIAFTRVFFERSQVRFAETYFRMKADGSLDGEQRLDAEPVFVTALTLARQREGGGQAMLAIAGRSGAFQAINQAMHQGAQLENLVVSPPIMMVTEGKPEQGGAEAKPWWRFWK